MPRVGIVPAIPAFFRDPRNDSMGGVHLATVKYGGIMRHSAVLSPCVILSVSEGSR